MTSVKRTFLGYNQIEVDEYLGRVMHGREEELVLLEENVKFCNLERENLEREIERLRLERKRQADAQAFLELAVSRLEESANALLSASEESISRVATEKNKKTAVQQSYLANLEEEIKKVKAQMDMTMQGIFQFLKDRKITKSEEEVQSGKVVGTIFSTTDAERPIASAVGEDIAGKMVVSHNGAEVGRVDRVLMVKTGKGIEGFYLKSEKTRDLVFIPADSIQAVKKDSLVIAADWHRAVLSSPRTSDTVPGGEDILKNLKKFVETQLTADGMSVLSDGCGPQKPQETAMLDSALTTGSEKLTAPVQGESFFEDAAFSAGGGFWGDVVVESGLKDIQSSIQPVNDAELFRPDESVAARLEETGPSPVDPLEYAMAVRKEKAAASPAVASEIRMVRHRYVVGKLAGEDLYGSGGEILIGKNQKITPEVVERAEREGKLAELIVHMIIPGLEE